jgi:hypothetical protein
VAAEVAGQVVGHRLDREVVPVEDVGLSLCGGDPVEPEDPPVLPVEFPGQQDRCGRVSTA